MARPKGLPKTGGGSRKGIPNRVTADLKSMVIGALQAKGGQAYLERCADENPTAFLVLVGKVLPLQVQGDRANPLQMDVHVTHEERQRRAVEAIDVAFREVEAREVEPPAPIAASVPQPTAQLPAPAAAADSPMHATDGEPDDPGGTIPRDFARARDVARVPARYRPPRRLGSWSG